MEFRIRRASGAIFCAVALAAMISCKTPPKTQKLAIALKPTSIVFVTLDTVRADHLHCYGYDKIKTPTIDGLAARGVLFEKAVTQTPLTLPSHASMFTGENPNVNGVRDTGGFPLPSSDVTLARILERHGWSTAAFVSSFVFAKEFGFNQGFSVYDDRMPAASNGQTYAVRSAGVTVDHALAWLDSQSPKPYFVWLHFYDAHQPFSPPPEEFQRQYPGDTYDAEIAYMDQQLGRFLQAVKTKFPANQPLVVVLSDHGEGLGQHGEYHHGVFLYDSTVRIAWILAGPGVPAGVRIGQQARTIDVLPTILDLLGGKAPSAVQGRSMVAAFRGHPLPTSYSYEETLYPKTAMNWAALRGIHTTDWMYIRAPKPELYNLVKDPDELHNVIEAYPGKYRELEQQLKFLSRIGGNGTENIVSNQMDQQTMERLRSLGYAGGSSGQSIELDGSGADPKDRIAILKLLHEAKDSPAGSLPSARRIELYKEALAKDPTNPSIYYDLGDEYERNGQFEDNLQLTLDAERHGIKSGLLFSRLGQMYLRKGDMEKAIAYYQQDIQLDPLSAEAHGGLGTAYAHGGQLDKAAREFHQALAIRQYIPAYNGLGLVAVQKHDFAGARGNFERAVQLDPNYVAAQLNLGVLCMQTQDLPCARAAFQIFLGKASPAQYKDMIPKVNYALRTVLAPGG